jgi:hypothetical protein
LVERDGSLLVLRDQRGDQRYLRMSWHQQTRSVVVSHWVDGACMATTRVALADIPKLTTFLVHALHNASSAPPTVTVGPSGTVELLTSLLHLDRAATWAKAHADRLRARVVAPTRVASVVPLRPAGQATSQPGHGRDTGQSR